MSTSFYKSEYDCQCGYDYGSCGAKCSIILKSNNSCDVYTIYHTDGHPYVEDGPKTDYGVPTHFGDECLDAISKCVDSSEPVGRSSFTEKEWEFIINNP